MKKKKKENELKIRKPCREVSTISFFAKISSIRREYTNYSQIHPFQFAYIYLKHLQFCCSNIPIVQKKNFPAHGKTDRENIEMSIDLQNYKTAQK